MEILPITHPELFPGVQKQLQADSARTSGYPSFDRLNGELVSRGFAFYEHVKTGYSSYEERLKHTCAFELDRAYIYCQFTNNEVLKLFAEDIRPRHSHQIPEELIETLLWLGKEFGLCINDRDLYESFDLTDRLVIQTYIVDT